MANVTNGQSDVRVSEPFPISLLSNRYLIYDINTITYIRREHHICGVLIGTLPRIAQQNVFLGVPLELLPEEARLLVEKGAGFLVDDAKAHLEGLSGLSEDEMTAFRRALDREGVEAAKTAERRAEAKKDAAFKRLGIDPERARPSSHPLQEGTEPESCGEAGESEGTDDSVFAPSERPWSPASAITVSSSNMQLQPYPITPTTSHPPLPRPSKSSAMSLPKVPASYPLYAHLHGKGYFMTPGLRFGCQYSVYPGDPLRFHSHFLATGVGWDEELNLLDLVGGGRLGTGVKKGYLIGGAKERETGSDQDGQADVRTICIEWATM